MYKILIVDNEKAIRTGLAAGVDWAGINCQIIGSAQNGNEALKIIEGEEPDIVLSDINMEEMDGLELCSTLESKFPKIKCILITGFFDFNNAYNAIKLSNVVNLVLKPTSVFKVTESVEEAIKKIEFEKNHLELKREVQVQQESNRELRQSKILIELMDGLANEEDIPHILASENILLSEYAVITIHLSNLPNTEQVIEDRLLAENTVVKYIRRVFIENDIYLIVRHRQYIRIIINRTPNMPTNMNVIRERCTELSNIIDNCTNFFVAIGISSLHNNPLTLRQATSESESAAKFALFGGEYPIVEYSHVPKMSDSDTNLTKKLLDKLIDSISKLDIRSSLVLLEAINSNCQKIKLPFDEICNLYLFISNICTQQCYNYGDLVCINLKDQYLHFHQLCSICDLNELYSSIQEIVTLTINGLIESQTSSNDVVSNVERYIQINFANELSLEGIASVFNISSGYLGRLFKSKFNLNITSYIQNVRINKAKDLICNTTMHTYEIAQAVGISDPVYFSKLFKKVTGFRVRDYKQINQQENELGRVNHEKSN